MCGIFGVTGSVNPFDVVVDGLRTLEYRGYDSAGVTIVDTDEANIWRARAAEQGGSIEKLVAFSESAPSSATSAIGHTRWATHGGPTEQNAHPHFDCSGNVAIVHNGIIENHRELAESLGENGHTFSSETDSEVIAHLIENEVRNGVGIVEALRRTMTILRGDFAIAAVSAKEPEVIAAARRTSPLVVGTSGNSGLLSSDIAALLAHTRHIIQIDDNEIVEVRAGAITVYNMDGEVVTPTTLEVTWDASAAEKGGYDDFMSKEIREQPIAIADTLIGRIDADGKTNLEEFEASGIDLSAIERVKLIACGSSFHACLAARQMIETLAQIPCDVDIASEFRYREPVIEPHTLVIGVSQSGETNDTMHAMREAKRRGATCVVMTNVVGSAMAREADGVLYTRAGPEIGVASTKCHVAQLVLLDVFALHLAQAKSAIDEETARIHAKALLAAPSLVERVIAHADDVAAVAAQFVNTKNFYYLGRRLGYPVALEGALKLKELAYVRAEAYAAGEMKHGPISLIEPGSVVVVVATRTPMWDKVMGNIAEMKARGATIVAVADEGDTETAAIVDAVLEVPPMAELCSPIVNVVPLQFFAYEIARSLGNDVDRPRNLAKVVTVE